jgi:hypothetical protein
VKQLKSNILNFLDGAIYQNKDIVIGIYDSEAKNVKSYHIVHNKVKSYREAFDAIYGDDLVNKAFNRFSVFAVKYFDGKDYTLEDYNIKNAKPLEKKERVEKKDVEKIEDEIEEI